MENNNPFTFPYILQFILKFTRGDKRFHAWVHTLFEIQTQTKLNLCFSSHKNTKIFAGYPEEVMNKLGMKGVLKVDSPLGLTVVLCQPTGDL